MSQENITPVNTNPTTNDEHIADAGNTNVGPNDGADAPTVSSPEESTGTDGDTLGGETLGGDSGDTAVKNTDDWVTGDEPMTGAQRSYLDTLAREAGEELSADLTKAEASEHIERLQEKTGRGK
ncbi:DUF3072 domain-containing protein [Labedella endophytica]|jgi:hypothetical protein|uniref:DUF3072 domain-containing protein n=1 Tax=Labedella endophytica TaxID=1523160 RepID=A0A433JRJ8_9MICO|nr:DUF3072 domain-containing protein [Labedella endophytica]